MLAGPILNDPTVDKTPDPESCQLFCQTVAECTYFSWADGDYSWEIYALGWVAGCWLYQYTDGQMNKSLDRRMFQDL